MFAYFVQVTVRVRHGKEGGAKPNEIKHLQSNKIQPLSIFFGKEQSLYIYLFLINFTELSISAQANMSGKGHIHKAKHKHSQHLSCSKNAKNSLMREGTSAGNLMVSLSPFTQETRDETYLFRTVPEVHDHG